MSAPPNQTIRILCTQKNGTIQVISKQEVAVATHRQMFSQWLGDGSVLSPLKKLMVDL